MEPTVFQAHPEIIEQVFDALDSNTLLNCRLVCKTWNQFLENPNFWLKKLKEIGQPEEIETAWKNLIAKSNYKIEKGIFAKCLRMKFTEFIRAQEKDDKAIVAKVTTTAYLKCTPLFTAAYFGIIDIVKLIYQLGEDCNRKMFVKVFSNITDYYVMPIFAAIENGHTDVAKFFLETPQEQQKPSYHYHGYIPIMSAIRNKNLDLVKFLVPKMPNLNISLTRTGKSSLIHLAIRDYEILKYLVSQPSINPNLQNFERKTPLQMLSDDKYTFGTIPPEDITKMIRILAPLADKNQLYSGSNRSPLHIAASSGNIEALNALLEFFDPNEPDNGNYLPLQYAMDHKQIEAVKILAPLSKDLTIRDYDRKYPDRKMAKIIEVLQSTLDERQGISKEKIYDKSKKIEEPAQKKIRVEPRVDNLYELPFENKFEVYSKEQIESMIKLFKENEMKNSQA